MAVFVLHLEGTAVPMVGRVILLLLCAYGRMYFWAHHLLDVICGACAGALVVKVHSALSFGETWFHAACTFLLFLTVILIYLKRMSKHHHGK